MTQTVSPADCADLTSRGSCFVVDVRTPAEYAEAHLEGAANAPLADVERLLPELRARAGDHRLVLVCRTGQRATLAKEKLARAGLEAAVVLDGGMASWSAEGRPVVGGRRGMVIERQVRIAAGALVVLGVALGLWVHTGFLALAAFVGCGLVFAGVTDTCGMALLLAKLPHNRVRSLGGSPWRSARSVTETS
ncbi:MAG: sulfurtransferase [Planctomycetes bacterium]|nr:sulfurtransferase [Planctomycetota bacterium]